MLPFGNDLCRQSVQISHLLTVFQCLFSPVSRYLIVKGLSMQNGLTFVSGYIYGMSFGCRAWRVALCNQSINWPIRKSFREKIMPFVLRCPGTDCGTVRRFVDSSSVQVLGWWWSGVSACIVFIRPFVMRPPSHRRLGTHSWCLTSNYQQPHQLDAACRQRSYPIEIYFKASTT